MLTKKIFVKDNTVQITCPACNTSRTLPMEKFRNNLHLKVKCSCETIFSVEIEFRRKLRKKTTLHGYFISLPPHFEQHKDFFSLENGKRMRCKIGNLSLDGVGFTIDGTHSLAVDEKIVLFFSLDDSKHTELQKMATVRSIDGNYIGCEFIEKTDKKLGFYLLS